MDNAEQDTTPEEAGANQSAEAAKTDEVVVDPTMQALADAAAAAPAPSIADELRGGRPAAPAEPLVASGRHEYPDGSVVYGAPPFPDESPKQRAERELRESPEQMELTARQQAQANASGAVVTADQVQNGVQPQ